MNALGANAEYITDMVQQIEASLNLLLSLKKLYSENDLYSSHKEKLTKKDGVFDNVLLAFKTAIEAIDSQMAEYSDESKKTEFKKV